MSAPIPRYTLQPSESVVHVEPPSFNPEKTPAPKWKLFSLSASVLPEIMLYVFLLCLWSALVTCCFILWDFKGFAINPFIISILGVVIGLVLVFRTNTAYDRYWEARKLWSTLTSHLRNLSRIVIICSNNKAERHGVLNLIVAYAVSLKHHLRDEKGTRYQDLHNLLIHVPSFRPDRYQHPFTNLPIQISIYIGSWVRKAREANEIDVPTCATMLSSLTAATDCSSQLERIKTSPIPKAYSIHLEQTLYIYLLSLPFQLVKDLRWVTILAQFIAAFTLLGILQIASEIENPLGYDPNDLKVGDFCRSVQQEIFEMLQTDQNSFDVKLWSTPVKLENYERLIDLNE